MKLTYKRTLRFILNFYLILFIALGNTAPVFSEEVSESAEVVKDKAKELLDSARDVVDWFRIPKLPLPFEGKFTISKDFKEDHPGVEFKISSSSAILAVDDGEVVEVGEEDGGLKIRIAHNWGESVYQQVQSVIQNSRMEKEERKELKSGDKISKEQIIGQTTSKLFFGIKPKVSPLGAVDGFIDPLPYLPESLNEDVLGQVKTSAYADASGDNQNSEATSSAAVSFEDVSSESGFLYNYKYNLANSVSAHFDNKKDKRPGFAIVDKNYDYKLSFFLKEEGKQNSKIDGNTIEFPVTVSGIPMILRYTVSENQVKEELVLTQKPEESRITNQELRIEFEVQNKGLNVEQNGSEYNFRNQDGNISWQIVKPNIKDAAGKNGDIKGELKDSLYTLTIPTNFLKNASYPVVIDPTVVINTSSVTTASQPSTMKHIVRSSDATLHSFVQSGTDTTKCSSGGLWWLYSTDSGSTWTCGGQLSSDTTNAMFADARVDSSDNIYVVYSVATTGRNDAYDVFYRKLTKGAGASWTLESAQTVLDGSGTATAYAYATIEVEGTTRVWMATRYYDGTNYGITVYYSDGFGSGTGGSYVAPTWTQSVAALDTAGNNASYHIPTMVRYGSNIGVIYSDQVSFTPMNWRYRADSDGLTSWVAEKVISYTLSVTSSAFTAVSDSAGNVYLAANDGTKVYLTKYYSSIDNWSSDNNGLVTVSSAAASSAFVGLTTDGTSAWVFYAETNSTLPGNNKLVYKKCVPPLRYPSSSTEQCNSSSTAVVSYHSIFDKVWVYDADAGTPFADETTDAGDTGSNDVAHATSTRMVAALNDAIYFGMEEQFDAITWSLWTYGSGGTIAWEYCSAVDATPACTTWSSLSLNNQPAPNFTSDSWLAFTAPADWQAAKVNGESTAYYYVRARVSVAYSTGPTGTGMASVPQITWASAASSVTSDITHLIWTENAASPTRIRYTPLATTASQTPAAIANISPSLVGYSNEWGVYTPSYMRHVVKTSDGTLHAFVQVDTIQANGCSYSQGLLWFNSTDSGSTWTCQGQLSSRTGSSVMYADAEVDSSDNIYVVYAEDSAGANTAYDVFYRKLTKGAGANWTLETEQTALDALSTGSDRAFSFATLELQGTTRIWLAVRRYDGTNYQVSVYYSDGLGTAPTWTQSVATLDTANTNAVHDPTLVRFGSNIGVIYERSEQPAGTYGIYWRYRADSDGLTSWVAEGQVADPTTARPDFSVAGDTSDNIYLGINESDLGQIAFTYYNGTVWSSAATVAENTYGNDISVSTDGTNAWVFYGNYSGISDNLTVYAQKLVYKKCVPPFTASDCDSSATAVVSYHSTFDKVWLYDADAPTPFEDETTDAANTTTNDVAHSTSGKLVQAVGDIIYLGMDEKFDVISWDLYTGSFSSGGGMVAFEYYNGSSWKALTTYLEISTGGFITFVPHTDWATTQLNGESTAYYYIRARTTTAYTTAPIGSQMIAIPQVSGFNSLSTISSNTTPVIWTENGNIPYRIRYKTQTFASSNTSPSDPSSLGGHVLGAGTQDTTPTLTFTLSDPDVSDTVKYQIQIDDSSDFSSAIVDYTSALASQGSTSFTVGQSAGSGTYTTGSSGQTLSDGSYYWRVKAIDDDSAESSYSTANPGSIAFKVDTTAPYSFDLESPSDGAYTNQKRPTFKWKTASTPDATTSLSSYSFKIDNGGTGDFTISDIPVSRTTDYETSKFLVHYENFSDSDSTNNYISIYTKDSSNWSSSENYGELKEGKRTWKVTAYDAVSNSREQSRTLYADFTGPTISDLSVSKLSLKQNNYLLTTDTQPTITGTITDNYFPQRVDLEFYQENYFRGHLVSTTLKFNQSLTLSNSASESSLSFQLTSSKKLRLGSYQIKVSGYDKAGNQGLPSTLYLRVVSEKEIQEISKKTTVISNILVTLSSPTQVKITWSTNDPATSKVNYATTMALGFELEEKKRTKEHQMILDNLTPNITYFYQLTSVGQTKAESPVGFFTTPGEELPLPELPPAPEGSGSAVIIPPVVGEIISQIVQTVISLASQIVTALVETNEKIIDTTNEILANIWPQLKEEVTKIAQKVRESETAKVIEQGSKVIALGAATILIVPKTAFDFFSFLKQVFTLITELPLLLSRFFFFILTLFGIKKRSKPWGVVYDSLTKQPIDPAIVTLIRVDGEHRGEEQQKITDFEGRFGFLVERGTYLIRVEKKDYLFPSKILFGKTSDGERDNLYFGSEITFEKPDLISVDIPLDPVSFNWNQAAKPVLYHATPFFFQENFLMKFIYLGFFLTVVAYVLNPAPLNLASILLYLAVFAIRKFIKPKRWGVVYNKTDQRVLPLVNVRAFQEMGVYDGICITDQSGRYYLYLKKGIHFIKVEKETSKGSKTLAEVGPLTVKQRQPIIGPDIGVENYDEISLEKNQD